MTDLTSGDGASTRRIFLLQALDSAPARLAEVAGSVPDGAHGWQPDPETWSMRQLVAHLAGAEAPFLARLRRMIEANNPWLPYFGPEVARPDAPHPLPDLLARFRAERDGLLGFLSGLSPQAWERPGIHETMGPTTLAHQVQNLTHHDAEHLQQLYELRQAWENHGHA